MKVQLKGFLCYDTSKYMPPDMVWRFMHYDPRQYKDADKIVVRELTLEAEAPDDFDHRQATVEKLREQEKMLRAEFSLRVKEINDRINSLLALENAA